LPYVIDKNQITPEIIKKHGEPIFNQKDLASALFKETFLKPGSPKADQTHYQRLGFQCLCNAHPTGMHPMNEDFMVKLILSASGEKFLYKCSNIGYYIFFQVKAKFLVNHYCSPIWFCEEGLFEKEAGEILKRHKNYNDINS
tara:strand:+ start:95 stop:520 length:426 start_codon:yes stop_codon:yes gene_type:complete